MTVFVRFLVAGAGWIVAGSGSGLRFGREALRQGPRIVRLAIFGLIGLALLWGWLAWREIARAQEPVVSLVELSVTLPSGGRVEVDREALGQAAPGSRQARDVVLMIDNTGRDGVVLRNARSGSRLLLDDGAGLMASDRWRITDGARALLPNDESVRFSVSEREGFEFGISGRDPNAMRHYRHRHDGAFVRIVDGVEQPLPSCAPLDGVEGWFDSLGRGATSVLTAAFSPVHALLFARRGDEHPVATLGGSKDCDEHGRLHVALAGLPWRTLRLVRRGEGMFLSPDRGGNDVVDAIRFEGGSGATGGFGDLPWPAEELHEIVIGRTRYGLHHRSDPDGGVRITFTPREGTTLIPAAPEGRPFAAPACRNLCSRWSQPYRVLERLTNEGFVRHLEAGGTSLRLMIGCALLAALFVAAGRGESMQGPAAYRQRIRLAAEAVVAWPLVLIPISIGLSLIEPAWFGLDPMAVTAANWVLAGFAIVFLSAAGILTGLFWLSIALMATIGGLTLSGLAADGSSDLWAGHLIKHKLLVLDLLPPLATALALVPPRTLRPWLHGLVAGGDAVSRLARYGPMLLLLVLLLVWTLFGSETGIAGFQPVEAGKFATALLCAGLVAALDETGPQHSGMRALLGQAGSLGLMAVFLGLLLWTPVWQSDFSPALIIVLLAVMIGGTWLVLRAATWLGGAFLRIRERRRSPVAFLPVRLFPKAERWLVIGLAIVVTVSGLGAWFGAGPLGRAAFLAAVGVESWPGGLSDRLKILEEGFGKGLRVPTERVIAWIDLDLGRVSTEAAAYRDLEFQVIRSRSVISNADCGLASPLDAATATLPIPMAGIVSAVDRWTAWSSRHSDLCGRGNRDAAPSAARRNVLFEGAPIDIPVVQFDFAASYLMGRFGLGAALLFYAGQVLCVLTALVGITRLAFARDGDRTDRTVRWFLAVLVAGSTGLFVLHWTISWSNVLGLLPVMGQPMTWLSAATSHHLFMAIPATLAILAGLCHGESDTRRVFFRAPPERQRRFFLR